MTNKRKTKIVATIGPACSSVAKLEELMLAGANVFRLNFSHGTHEQHTEHINSIRAAAKNTGCVVGIFQDLCGPKIRITDVEGGSMFIKDGGTVEIRHSSNAEKSTEQCLYVEGLNPPEFLKPGNTIFLSDGAIKLTCLTAGNGVATAKIDKGGKLRARNGIAFPDSSVNLPATTEKDLHDLTWAAKHHPDFVALSFVQNAADVLFLKARMKDLGINIPIISKIERRVAMANLEEIINVSDSLMVARGDLGLEYPLEQLPALQRRIIEKGNAKGIPVIVATQMLLSMTTALRPTRAEVSDVAYAVMSGADAVMLSEESAVGENPAECVRYLGRIAEEAEKAFDFNEFKLRLNMKDKADVPDAIAAAAAAAAFKTSASAIVSCTETGFSARMVAKYRPQQALYGTSNNVKTLGRLCLVWGVIPIAVATTSNQKDEVRAALDEVKKRENLPDGSLAVVTGGLSVRVPGSTSLLQIVNL
jgi:pyruvate kinase